MSADTQPTSEDQLVAVNTDRLSAMIDILTRDSYKLEFDHDVLVCLKELRTMREVIARGANIYTTWLVLRNMVEISG